MKTTPAMDLTHRLTRPQRIGVFGHRGAGKTTLLTMLYREAVAGRLPGFRLAAADTRTAVYLGDKIKQLEAGQLLPGTLGETELRFHLYHQGARFELLFLDYQGEHVALGRQEPIRDFLKDCDAILLCLDAPLLQEKATSGDRWTAEQEVEQVAEDYLAAERAGEPHRPMALVITKADLLGSIPIPQSLESESPRAGIVDRLGMTWHTLRTHCPAYSLFTVSALGPAAAQLSSEPQSEAIELTPAGLEGPIGWLADALAKQDTERLEQLWRIAPNKLRLLERATTAYARRHPDAPQTTEFQRRLWQRRKQLWGRRTLVAGVALLTLFAGLWGYDLHGAAKLNRDLEERATPGARREAWGEYLAWYPTRHLFRDTHHQQEQLAELDSEVREATRQERLVSLRQQAENPDADPEAVWANFLQFGSEFPEHDTDAERQSLRLRIKQANDARKAERATKEQAERDTAALQALRDLDKAERSQELPALIDLTGKLLREHAKTASEAELQVRRTGYVRRLDERDFEAARDYSKRHPTNFVTRGQKYQQYLDHHSNGAFATQARSELGKIAAQWDKHDYSAIRDHFQGKPTDLQEHRARGRAYLAAHADGKYRQAVTNLLRWCDRVGETNEYKVVLKSGSFSKKAAATVSRGAYLSVMLEVNGVKYGPSHYVTRSYAPEWDYEFSRPVRWKVGDTVRIVVYDNYYWRRLVSDQTFDEPLSIQRISGTTDVKHGNVTFTSDFAMPALPKAD